MKWGISFDDFAAVLQIRKSYRDNFGIIIFSVKKKHTSVEPSRRDGSNEGSQHMFSLRNKKKHL